jgi:hypothetical protein
MLADMIMDGNLGQPFMSQYDDVRLGARAAVADSIVLTSLNGDGLRQITRLINVTAAAHRDVIRQQLQGND